MKKRSSASKQIKKYSLIVGLLVFIASFLFGYINLKNIEKGKKTAATYTAQSTVRRINAQLNQYVELSEFLGNVVLAGYNLEQTSFSELAEMLPNENGNETNFDDKKARYVFVCEDTGIGMASEYLPHIFDEFSREHTATENKVSGTGLGLSIVKSFVELMNGRIHVVSEPGKGTKFTVEIPLELASEEDICKKELPEQTFMTDKNIGKRILLAEDNEQNAEIAMELLKEEGFLIDWVKDGQECFDKLEEADEGYYDLILMDIQMPILNGYDTTAKIRQMENPKKATTPIVAMTANSFDEDIEMTQKAGMNGFIAKPLDAEKMFTILKQSIVEN